MNHRQVIPGLLVTLCLNLGMPAVAQQPDITNNYGFPFGFSLLKTDSSVPPAQNFSRYSSGRWWDAARIPDEWPLVNAIQIMVKQRDQELLQVARTAARAGAAKGTPQQQVGDFFSSGLDQERLRTVGARALEAELSKVASVKDDASLARVSTWLAQGMGVTCFSGPHLAPDPQSSQRYAVFIADAALPLRRENYLDAKDEPLRQAYLKKIAAMLELSGSSPEAARSAAQRILAMETRVAARKLTGAELRDPAKQFRRMSLEELRRLVPRLDLEASLTELGVPLPKEVVVDQLEAVVERNRIVAESTPEQLQEFLRWELLNAATHYLGPDFIKVHSDFRNVMLGPIQDPPLESRVLEDMRKVLGHPLSQLYVRAYFSDASRKDAKHLVDLVRAEFRRRLVANTWLSQPTREYAVKKLDAMKVYVGYPDHWIDYSSVDIRPDDYVGNFFRANRFLAGRQVRGYGHPIVEDLFIKPGESLPIDINASYTPESNKIEIPAAFLRPPVYDPKGDLATNLGALAAVIGHEFTHGFDSQGRKYDADGNIRDWWTPQDAAHFEAENKKLVEQASAYQILPGLHLNGDLESGENLADVGGVTMAFAVLQDYLEKNPQARAPIDGLTPEQRFFLAWSQLWAEKAKDTWYTEILIGNEHAPGPYRQLAPHQHVGGFYKAYKIGPGDPAWLPEDRRVHLW